MAGGFSSARSSKPGSPSPISAAMRLWKKCFSALPRARRRSVMPIALLTLLRLHFRGKFRHSLRGIRTPRGLVFLLLGILVLSLWLGPALYRALHMPHADPQMVRTFAPFAILSFCLSNLFTSFGDAAVPFTQ